MVNGVSSATRYMIDRQYVRPDQLTRVGSSTARRPAPHARFLQYQILYANRCTISMRYARRSVGFIIENASRMKKEPVHGSGRKADRNLVFSCDIAPQPSLLDPDEVLLQRRCQRHLIPRAQFVKDFGRRRASSSVTEIFCFRLQVALQRTTSATPGVPIDKAVRWSAEYNATYRNR